MQKSMLPASAGVFAVLVLSLTLVFSLPFGAARAQEEADEEQDLITILITASRFAETADEALTPVTVITREEIEEKQATTIEEVLRTVPGVALTNNGGVGKNTQLFLRGTNPEHVLVLIDGVKIGSATSGDTPFQHLPLDQIERIEVVRGPRSSLYGSEAVGGVIQIFTRKGSRETRHHFAAGGGTHNTRSAEVGVSGGTANGWYHIGASTYETDGFDACQAASCTPPTDPTGDDDDDYKNDSLSLRGGVAVSESLELEGNFFLSESDNEFDGNIQNSPNETESTTQTTSVKATLAMNQQWRSSLLISEAKDKTDNFRDGQDFSNFYTTTEQINWQNSFHSGGNRVIVGVDFQEDEIDSSQNYAVTKRDNTGVFALLRASRGGNDFEAALRNDDNEQFGNHTTGSIAWGRYFGNGWRLTASYGTAFNAPSFNDLYWPVQPFFRGNPDLEPEESESFDLGFSRIYNRATVAVNLFRTEIDDLIAYSSTDLANINIDKVKIIGLEIALGARPGAWDVNVSATFQNPEEASGGANDGNTLIRRPKRFMTLDAARQFGRYRLGAELFARSKAYIDAANKRATGGFTILNLRGEVKLHRNWLLLLKVNNATDKEYQTVATYPQDGRNFLATLRYTP